MTHRSLFCLILGHSVRLSEYIYKPNHNSTTDICYPEGFQWKRNVSVSVVVTGKQNIY